MHWCIISAVSPYGPPHLLSTSRRLEFLKISELLHENMKIKCIQWNNIMFQYSYIFCNIQNRLNISTSISSLMVHFFRVNIIKTLSSGFWNGPYMSVVTLLSNSMHTMSSFSHLTEHWPTFPQMPSQCSLTFISGYHYSTRNIFEIKFIWVHIWMSLNSMCAGLFHFV